MSKKNIQKRSNNIDKLDTVIDLLKHSLAVQLYKAGVTQDDIAKHLHVGKSTVVSMVRGVKRESV